MKKVALMLAAAAAVLAPTASAAHSRASVGHNVRQYVQNRDHQLRRATCITMHGHLVKYGNGRVRCVVPKRHR